VVKDFVGRVRERAVGEEVTRSLTPAQQVIKIVHEELVTTLGEHDEPLVFAARPPTVVLLAGLQGSGKTSTAAKLARWLAARHRKPMLVACDLQRPAAVQQLQTLGKSLQVPVYERGTDADPVEVATWGVEQAKAQGRDVVIIDTAGRLHIDEELMDQLVRVKQATKPHNVLLVLDSMTGQDAVNVAQAFAEAVDYDGVILTKLDGDARGGAALAVRAVTGKPIKYVSVGEKLDQLEPFHPDRLASRILGMGDVMSLIERAQEQISENEAREMEAKLRKAEFTLEDFLGQLRQVRKMTAGQGMAGLLGMLPGVGRQIRNLKVDERQIDRVEAIILSMTPSERRNPRLIDGSRRRRIAAGSGTNVQQVNQLLGQFKQMQRMMKQVGRGKMPQFPGLMPR
jgi:signal recognition particle subunit SRP54